MSQRQTLVAGPRTAAIKVRDWHQMPKKYQDQAWRPQRAVCLEAGSTGTGAVRVECGEYGTCWRCRALELGLEISGCPAGWSRTQQVPPALPLNAQPWTDYLPGKWKGWELPQSC